MKQKKILHLMSVFSAPSQTFIYDLINGLEEDEDYANTILCYRDRVLQEERPFRSVVLRSDIENSYLTSTEKLLSLVNKNKYFSLALARFIDEQEFEVIHCHFVWVVWSCLLDALKSTTRRVPVVVSAHGTDVCHALKDSFKRNAVLQLLARERVVFTGATPYMCEQLNLLGVPSSKLRNLPNAIKDGFFVERTKREFSNGDTFRIISNGRLVSWKGHEYLIRALQHFQKNIYSDVHLTIVGEGECKADLVYLAKSLGVYEFITFTGWVEHSVVPNLLMEHDVYVQPSLVDEKTLQTETFGVAVLEAIAVGLPVVVSRVGGLPFVVGDGGCFAEVVAPKNYIQIAEALERVFRINDRDNYCFARMVVDRFSSKKQISACKKIYAELDSSGGVL